MFISSSKKRQIHFRLSLNASCEQEKMTTNHFSVDYAKLGTSACKRCKTKIAKGEIRLAKAAPSPYADGGIMKLYHHVQCMFDSFLNARATTKIIESTRVKPRRL